jgi:enoyl-CoA hydratase/carnithine racemase
VPVIAAIDGVCIGGALEFAASCDLRIVTRRARFATPEVRIGLGASNAGTLLLPEVLGESAARELLLTGDLKNAGWMDRHGFCNDVVDDLDAGIEEWVTAFDRTTRPAVARTKRMLNDRFGDLLPEAMARETQTCIDLFPTPEAQEAIAHFAKRH